MNPVVYLGQDACQVACEIKSLCKKEKLGTAPGVYVDTSVSGPDVIDVNMPNLFSYPSENSPSVDKIVEQIIIKLESCDNPSGIGIVADLCSGAGSSLSCAVITEIKDIAPHLRIQSVFTMPPENTVYGINVINSVMTTQIPLEYADSVMIRGLDDALMLVGENNKLSLIHI